MVSKSAAPCRTSAADDRKFGKRFWFAVDRRLFPNTSLHFKQLMHVFGRSADTLARWRRGESEMAAEAIANVVDFFTGQGDRAFLFEIYGQEAAAAHAELDALKRRIAHLEKGMGHATVSDRGRDPHAATAGAPSGAVHHESRVVGAADPAVDERVKS